MAAENLTEIPGVPEAALTATAAARLPDFAPDAPWSCRCQAVVWVMRPSPAAAAALPESLSHRRPLTVIGGLVRYLETPVGPYDEAFAALVVRDRLRLGGHIPFMAVSSRESVVGGRRNWALPKVLGSFAGPSGPGWPMSAAGPDWGLQVRAQVLGRVPALPVLALGINLQEWPDGELRRATLRLRGRVRPALVTVDTLGSPRLRALMAPGRHPGLVLQETRFSLGAAR